MEGVLTLQDALGFPGREAWRGAGVAKIKLAKGTLAADGDRAAGVRKRVARPKQKEEGKTGAE
jgi:hypothetical protein